LRSGHTIPRYREQDAGCQEGGRDGLSNEWG
jgi:hypothetical protein